MFIVGNHSYHTAALSQYGIEYKYIKNNTKKRHK